ncbi:glutamine synthetase [Ranunculus cassubicifolius]
MIFLLDSLNQIQQTLQSLSAILQSQFSVHQQSPKQQQYVSPLLSDLINLDLSDVTDKIIAEFIWIGGSGMEFRSKARVSFINGDERC